MIAEMTVAMREMILGGAADEATARQVDEAMRVGREGLLPVIGLAVASYQGLGKVQAQVDERVQRLDPSDPLVGDLERFSLAIHRVRTAFGDVIREMPEAVFNCWIEDKKATAETGKECGVYMAKETGKGVPSCQDN
jgi:hypothetical protein